MIDTVSRSSFRPLLPHVTNAIRSGTMDFVHGWKFWTTNDGAPMPGAPANVKLKGEHLETGLFVHGTPDALLGWTVSLPGVLHGYNGVQLKNDEEISQSFVDANSILNQVSSPPRLAEPFRRLDIAMNLSHPEPERLVLALRNARHPWIRKATEQYSYGNIRFPGSQCVFTAYWKKPPKRSGIKRNVWCTPKVLRLELQLKTGDKIAEFLGLNEPAVLHLPPMAVLYLKFREFMLAFPHCEQVNTPCSMAALLALCESHDIRLPGGETVMDWHRRSVSASGYSKMRKQVAGHTNQFLSVDWSELLPSDHIPETVDVHLNGTTAIVPATPITLPIKPAPVRLERTLALTHSLN